MSVKNFAERFEKRRQSRGSSYSYTPTIPGAQTGNAAAVQLTPEQQYRSLLRPEVQPYYDRFLLQGGNFKEFDQGAALEQSNLQRTADQNFKQTETENKKANQPPATEEYNAERDTLEFLRGLTSPEARRQQAQDALDIQKQAMDYAQEKGKESAKLAFQYEMMGRIPDAIANALAGSGQLMREGAKDISNTVMRGVEALPKPNIAARAYQQPTFKYFQ